MNPWEWSTLMLLVCLVSGCVGWCTASMRIMELAHRVSSMEAAVAAYWDRIRKRMMVEPRQAPAKKLEEMSNEEIMELGRRNGLLSETREAMR